MLTYPLLLLSLVGSILNGPQKDVEDDRKNLFIGEITDYFGSYFLEVYWQSYWNDDMLISVKLENRKIQAVFEIPFCDKGKYALRSC